VIHRFAKKDHVKLVAWHEAQEVASSECVLALSTILFRPLSRLVQRCLGYVDTNITLVGILRQFIRRIARAASKVKDSSVPSIFFKKRVDAIPGRVVYEIPLGPGELSIPKDLLNVRGTIGLEKSLHKA